MLFTIKNSPVWVLMIQIGSSYIAYIFAKFASKVQIQGIGQFLLIIISFKHIFDPEYMMWVLFCHQDLRNNSKIHFRNDFYEKKTIEHSCFSNFYFGLIGLIDI